ncbi:MAG: hypothetical protein J6328_02280 [Bacilli bacterium]|nr:hypothetical protein [Bacilli bacterium]
MAKFGTFLKNHIVSAILVLLGLFFIAFKIPGLLKWDWWLVLIPFYVFAAYWVVLIGIGAYLTKKEEKEHEEE